MRSSKSLSHQGQQDYYMDDHVEDTDVGHLQRADDSRSEGEDYFDASDSCDSEGDVEYDIADEAYRSGYSDYKKTRMTLETLEDAVAMKEALSQGAQGFCEASDHGLECLSENGEENDAKPEWDDQSRQADDPNPRIPSVIDLNRAASGSIKSFRLNVLIVLWSHLVTTTEEEVEICALWSLVLEFIEENGRLRRAVRDSENPDAFSGPTHPAV
ncbi:hypothetical protein NCC49_002453 [Naganishia albida]|nr:hypothetical protein NCC49_002453 [Naganishia albida]